MLLLTWSVCEGMQGSEIGGLKCLLEPTFPAKESRRALHVMHFHVKHNSPPEKCELYLAGEPCYTMY